MKLKWILIVGSGLFFVIAIGVALQMRSVSPVLIGGEISVSEDIRSKIKADHQVLFITLLNTESPMPIAAMRQSISTDLFQNAGRYSFTMTPERAQMMGGQMQDLEGSSKKVRVKARLDIDGQGGMDQPGDLVGIVDNVTIGQRDLKIIIDREI